MAKSESGFIKVHHFSNRITIALLTTYLIVLVWILLFKLGVHFSYMPSRSVNLIPFDGLFLSTGKVDKPELILNIIIFIPLGIYVGVLLKEWTWRNKLLLFTLLSLLFEGLQYILKIGAFDITDIITNTIGGLFGLLIFRSVKKFFSNEAKSHNFINIVSVIGTITIVALLVLLKLNLLPIRYQ